MKIAEYSGFLVLIIFLYICVEVSPLLNSYSNYLWMIRFRIQDSTNYKKLIIEYDTVKNFKAQQNRLRPNQVLCIKKDNLNINRAQ